MFPKIPDVLVLISNILIITVVIRLIFKYKINYSVLTALFGIIIIGFAELFATLVYVYPMGITSQQYKSSFVHITAGSILMFLFVYALLKLIANNFIKARKRLSRRYNNLTILLSANLIAVFSMLLFVYNILSVYVDFKLRNPGNTYNSIIIIAIILIASVLSNLYIINHYIVNSLKYERLRKLNIMDSMTETLSRGAGLKFIEKQLIMSKKRNEDLTICYIDVNDLKVINDKLGHKEGDQLIKAIVNSIKDNIRETDVICRLGGDEFVIVFPGFNIEYSRDVMDRVSEKVSQLDLFRMYGYDISISYGFSEYGGNYDITVDSLLDQADRQMYINKRALKAMN
jgi:diguanylate cyclase (GGDEF)-like protein